MHSITSEQFETLKKNQDLCKAYPPVTEYAVFQIDKLKELIKFVEESPQFKAEDAHNFSYQVAVYLVREELINKESKVLFPDVSYETKEQLSVHSQNIGDNHYTQVIPIIVGCVATTPKDGDKIIRNCKPITDMVGNIKVVTSGGEGTGIIPPPPKTKG